MSKIRMYAVTSPLELGELVDYKNKDISDSGACGFVVGIIQHNEWDVDGLTPGQKLILLNSDLEDTDSHFDQYDPRDLVVVERTLSQYTADMLQTYLIGALQREQQPERAAKLFNMMHHSVPRDWKGREVKIFAY